MIAAASARTRAIIAPRLGYHRTFRRIRIMASPLLENLNPEQLAAVTLPHASALILAGAGSGKTRVLTTRIAWLLATGQAAPLSILAVTFTNKAAKEMLIAAVGADAGQHARHVDRHVPRPVQPDAARALPRREPAAALPDHGHAGPARADQADVQARTTSTTTAFRRAQLQWFIADAKEEGLRPNTVEAGDEFTRRQVEHYALYEAMCQREGVVDFAELLLRSYELLARQRRPARALPAPLLAPAGRRVPGHERAAVQVAASCSPGRTPRCSPSATTTSRSTRSAAPTSPTCSTSSATSRTPEQPVELIKLEQNYRSHGNILDAANALIQHNQARLGKNLWTSEGKGEPVRAFAAPTDLDEAAFVVDVVKALVGRRRARSTRSRCSIASNAQSRVLEHALFSAGIPYRVYGGMRFFERAEIKHALAYLRLIAAPDDDGAFLRVVNFPPRGIGARTLETAAGAARGAGHDAVAGGGARRGRRARRAARSRRSSG